LKRDDAAGLREALEAYLRRKGLKRRLDQASVVDAWPALVGPQIARVTAAEGVTEDGVLFVRVATAAWMQELQMQSRTILRLLADGGRPIRRIVWRVEGTGAAGGQ
jgi:predicted nucleic acid-binding Zn ribbon protein